MLRLIRRFTPRSFVAALLIACLFSLSAPIAAAADGPHDSGKSAGRDASLASNVASPAPEAKLPRVLYVAFEDAVSAPADATAEPASRPRTVAKLVESVNAATATPIPLPLPRQSSVVSTAPMSAGEKFGTWFRSKFLSVGTYGSAVFNGMWKELNDNDDFKKDTVENFFADSMTRAARSYASGTTNAFFEKALFASLFRREDRLRRDSGIHNAGR